MSRKGTKIEIFVLVGIAVLALLAVSNTPVRADDTDKAQAIVDKARITFDAFMRDKDYSWIHENIKNAKGILIYPQILRAGFFLGGSGGTGVFLVKNQEGGDWSQPAFYTVGAVSFGLQVGGETAETVILAMTQKAVESLYSTSAKLGGETSFAVGPFGAGAKSSVMTDFISFSMSKGAYLGLNLEGSVVGVRESLNAAYYGREVSPVQIIVQKEVNNKGSSELRNALDKAAK